MSLETGEAADAIWYFEKALNLCPAFFEATSNMGIALQQAGQLDKALESHKEAVKLNPDSFEAHNALGSALRATGDIDEAIKSSRLKEIQDLLKLQQMEFNKKSINSTLNVLVLKNGKKNKQYLGRSPFNQSIYFNSDDNNLIGSTIDINVTEAFQNSLTGIIKPYKNI